MDLKRKRLILYDLDGTLVDTRRDIADSANHVRVMNGLKRLDDEEIWPWVGQGLTHLIRRCLATEDHKLIAQGAKTYRSYYKKHMLDKSALYPGAREFLELFRGKNQAVITNKPNPFAVKLLQELFISRYFFRVIAGDSEFPHKPDTASTLALMKLAKVSANEVLWVGDSPVDIQTARTAGVDVVVLSHGFVERAKLKAAKPDGLFKDFRELVNFAKKELFGPKGRLWNLDYKPKRGTGWFR